MRQQVPREEQPSPPLRTAPAEGVWNPQILFFDRRPVAEVLT